MGPMVALGTGILRVGNRKTVRTDRKSQADTITGSGTAVNLPWSCLFPVENEIDTAKRERAWYRALRVAGHPQNPKERIQGGDPT